MTAHDLREHFADAMLAMRDLCESDGLPWQAEVITLIGAWGQTRRAMGRHGDLHIQLPQPDPGERSPAHALLTRARNTPTGRLAPDQRAPNASEGMVPPSPPPPLPQPRPELTTDHTPEAPGRMLGPVPKFYNTRLSGARLYQLLATGRADGRSVLVCDPSITLDNARNRCSSMSTLCASHRLRCNIGPDGLVLIRRVPR